jgi:peptidyl-prolyl cis-trans isomerase D
MFNGQSTTVGSINGEKVEAIEFNKKVNQIEENYRAQGMQTNDMMTQNIVESIWNSIVQEQLIKEQASKLGLTVTPKEVGSLLFSDDAPQEFKQLFVDKKTGAFDVNAAKTWMNNLKKSTKPEEVQAIIDQLIKPIEGKLLTEKYTSLLTQGAYVPTWMIEKSISDNTSFSSFSFLNIPYTTISDSSVKVSDQEIEDYVGKHKDEFKQEHVKGISFVSFSSNPTAADSSKIFNQLSTLKSGFLESSDAKAFVTTNNSSLPYYDGYALKSKLQMGAKDSIIGMSTGSVIGPYLDGGSYVLAKKLDSKTLPDSVTCRHILIGTVNPASGQQKRTDSAAKKQADSVFALIKSGVNFASLATVMSDDEESKLKGGEYQFSSVDMGRLPPEFAEFIFNKKQGNIEVVKTTSGYHIIEILSQKNFDQAYKVAYMSKRIVSSEETDATASNSAIQFAGLSRDSKTFDEALAKMK